jgi:hypothetical protein
LNKANKFVTQVKEIFYHIGLKEGAFKKIVGEGLIKSWDGVPSKVFCLSKNKACESYERYLV